jgi:hydrogenase/urease accessory protein HupE
MLLAAIPQPARAHLVTSGLGPFYDGASHFLLTPEDFAPALAMALFAGLKGAHEARLVLFSLPAAWLFGGLAGLPVPGFVPHPLLSAASFVLLGALVAGDLRIPKEWLLRLTAALGLANGFLNGSAMSQANLGALGVTGIVTALFLVVALAAALVVSLRAPWSRMAVRVAGSWIVATGLLLIGWSLRAEG